MMGASSGEQQQIILALVDLLSCVRTSPNDEHLEARLEARCTAVLSAAHADREAAIRSHVLGMKQRTRELESTQSALLTLNASLEQRVQNLEAQLGSYADMAKHLEEVGQVACSQPGSPAPWFSDPSLELPFELPSLRASPTTDTESMSIGELMVADLKMNSFEEICRRYEMAPQSDLGCSQEEAAMLGGSSWHNSSMD